MTGVRVKLLSAFLLLGFLWIEYVPHAVLAQETVDAAEEAAIAEIRKLGGTVRRIAANTDEKEVDFHLSGRDLTDESLAHIVSVKNVVALHLKNTQITDAGLAHLKGLKNLRRLHLEKTAIGDEGLANLAGLQELEYLNLYGTKVSDAGIAHLVDMKSLRRLYLWQTQVSDAGADQLATSLPDAKVIRGVSLNDPATAPRKRIVMDEPTLPLAGKPWKIAGIRFESENPKPGSKASVFFRAKGGKDYASAELAKATDGRYEATIPDSVTGAAFQYYIEIREAKGPPSTHPALGARVPADVIPDTEPPVLPADPETVLVKNYRVTFNWKAATDDRGIRQYHVFRGKDQAAAIGADKPIGETIADTLEFSDATPPAGQTVFYAIKPIDVAGRAGEARVIKVDVPEDLPPDNDFKLAAASGSKAVVLSWDGTPEPDVKQLLIFRADTEDGELKQVAELDKLETKTWLDKEVKDDTKYRYALKLRDGGGHVSKPTAEAVAESGLFLRRINCGGLEIPSPDGSPWDADKGNLPGTGLFNAKTVKINGTTEQLQHLYQAERWSYQTIKYRFSVDPGQYQVTLHFAETNRIYSAAGKRTFDVYFNGEKTHAAVDVFSKAGAATAWQLPTKVEVQSKSLVIELRKGAAGPSLKGIEVRELGE
ncbi:MAG: malectin domain-containing carbohydrate-binding protein [Pirellulales bacterium]